MWVLVDLAGCEYEVVQTRQDLDCQWELMENEHHSIEEQERIQLVVTVEADVDFECEHGRYFAGS